MTGSYESNWCRIITTLNVVVLSTVFCAAEPTALPQLSWNEEQINVVEGSIIDVCFSSKNGSAMPYQVNVGTRGKGSNPATGGGDDYVVLSPLNFTIPVSESGVQQCITLSLVEDNIAEGLKQFELFFENFPSNFVAAGYNSTLCVNITDNDVAVIGFEKPTITVSETTQATNAPCQYKISEGSVSESMAVANICISIDIAIAITIKLTGVTEPVCIATDKEATADSDYKTANLTVTFLPSNSSQTRCATVHIIDDIIGNELNETFSTFWTSDMPPYSHVRLITIIDNDGAPTLEWEEREMTVSEGEDWQVCFTSDIGTAVPYQVIIGVREKGQDRPANTADFVVRTPLNLLIPKMDTGGQFCLNLTIVNDTVGEDSEQFEFHFENIPSEFAKAGDNDTICITIQENDATEFCLAETVVVMGIEYLWPKTRAGANARLKCSNNSKFSVLRTCNTFGTWQSFDIEGCGVLTYQLREILRFLEKNVIQSQENITVAIQRLDGFTNDSVNSPVDQIGENLNIIAIILTIVADHVKNQTITDSMITEAAAGTVNSLLQWDEAAIQAQASSILIQSFEVITSVNAQQLPSETFSLPFITLNTQQSNLKYLQVKGKNFVIEDEKYDFADEISTSSSTVTPHTSTAMSVRLPPSLFQQISNTNTNATGLVFTLYEKSTLFPVGKKALSQDATTKVGTNVLAASVGRDIVFENLQDPVTIVLQLTESQGNESDSIRCVSWDFDLADWNTRGCMTTVGQNDTVTCTCNHLTNFAVLIDICLRQDDCQPINPIVDTLLTYVSYIGIVISIVGLILTIITTLAFKKLRRKDVAEHHVQFAIALLLMLMVALVLISLTSESANTLYGVCLSISVLVHYFSLVAVMWMGAEALLMFRKVAIVFVRVTTKYIITVSLVCWLVPIVPVLISLITDLSTGDDPAGDIIIRRAGGESFCFLTHPGAFWGAFLGPILLIMIFNSILFIWVICVMVQHATRKTFQTNRKMQYKKIIEIIIRLSGVMLFFGLTWLFAILTISVPGLRETFQILFTIFNSFQGAYVFLFFCVLNQEARESWKRIFLPIHKKTTLQSYNLSHTHEMNSTKSTKLKSGSQKYYLSSIITSGVQSNSELSVDDCKIEFKSE